MPFAGHRRFPAIAPDALAFARQAQQHRNPALHHG
jgi:hypothetical protein